MFNLISKNRWWITPVTVFIFIIAFNLLMSSVAGRSEEAKVWQYMGDDTYVGNFSVDSQENPEQRVFFYCIMVRNSSGMAKGAPSVFCK